MSMLKWAKAQLERNRRSRRAISTIMANLTMLVIVVVLSSLLFVWAVSSFGAYQGGAGYWFSSKSLANQERISVETVFFTGASNNVLKIYIRNVGAIPFTIASVYVNSSLYNLSPTLTVNVTQVVSVPGPNGLTLVNQQWVHNDVQTIKIATLRGTVVTTTWVA